MLDGLKPYREYHETGEPLIGAIPVGWHARPLKRLCTRSALYGANIPASDYVASGVRFLRTTDFTDDGVLRRGGVFVSDDDAREYLLADGDLLVSRSGTIGRSFRYRAKVHGPCAYAGYLVRFVPAAIVHPDYLFYFTKCTVFADFLRISAVSSTIENVNGEKYANMPVVLPPPAEQAGIVRFLGAVDRKVNRFIRAKRRLIEVLTEQKQAIITHAVTKGLNPHAPLKPSGIDWLGDVPEHWEMWQIGHFAAVGNGSTPSRGNMAYWTGGTFPWLNSSTVNSRTISASDQFVTETALRECHLPRVSAGSVLVAITGQGKTRGMAAVLTIEATINQHLAFIRPRSTGMTATPEYLRLFLHAAYPELRRMSDDSGSTKGALTCEDLRHFRVALMPRAEQEAVVSAVAEQTRDVDAAIDRTEREIDLIREYRTRLVADVVTGKVDVRAAAASLPDEAADPRTDPGAAGAQDGADDPAGEDDQADAGADLEPALDGAGTDGEDEP